jgi:nitrogen fixation/metabolism regulation signal transduction histidine kinase
VSERRSLSETLDKIAARKQIFEEKIEAQKDKPRILDIIQLNLSQLNEYYTINKSQSKHVYGFSIFMIFVGFLLIVIAVVLGLMASSRISVTLIIGIAGLLSEFIGATSLNLYKESNKHVNEFLERLTYLQKVMLAIELVDRISENKQEEQLSGIITSLMKIEKH